ncbi:hypothetical protein Peur_024859 [Populus x canadensis]
MEARFYVLTIVLVLAVFAPAAMTCYGRDISIHNFYKIENSRMVLQRRIPDGDSPYYWRRGNTAATKVSPPVASMSRAMKMLDHQPSTGYKAMALVSDGSPEMGKVKIASTNHFSTEVKVGQRGRRHRRAIPSPPPPKPNRLGRWKWIVPPVFGAPPTPTPTPPMPSSPPPPPSPLSSSKGA